MKYVLAVFASALLQTGLFGDLRWSGGDYDPATWAPSPSNVIFGVKHYNDVGEVTRWNGDPKLTLKNDSFVLNNGAVPKEPLAEKEITKISPDEIFALNGGQLKWNFPEAVHLCEVKIFSRWADGGRDGIYIKQVRIKKEGSNDWVCIAGDDSVTGVARGDIGRHVDDSPGNRNESSGALWMALSDPGGYLAEEKVHALNIVFSGTQDNNGTGYVEIEANAPVVPVEDPSGNFKVKGLGVSFGSGGCTLSGPAEIEMLKPVALTTSAGYYSVHDAGDKVSVAVVPGKSVSVRAVEQESASVIAFADGISDLTCVGGTVAGRVFSLGKDAESVNLFLKYGRAPDALDKMLRLDYSLFEPGEFQVPVDNVFAPSTTYYAQIVAKNDLSDAEYACGDVFPFTTRPENSGPGLWQRKIDNRGDYGGDVGFHEDVFAVKEGVEEWDRHIENGAVMAYWSDEYYSDFSELWSGWYASHRTFIYQGYMYLKAGSYKIVSNIDDYAYFGVDGADVHHVNVYTKDATTTWTCEETGWHRVSIAAGDHEGGRGPMTGNDSIDAFYYEYNGDGIKRRFIDPGDGSLFVATLTPGLRLLSATRSGDDFNGVLNTDFSMAGASVYRLSGNAYCGVNTNEWREVVRIDDAGEENSRVVRAQDLPEDTAYIRYLAVLTDGSKVWSNTLFWEDIEVASAEKPRAVVNELVPHPGGATVLVGVVSTGLGEKVSVSVVAQPAGDERNVSETVFDDLAVGSHSLVIGGLKPNRRYKLKIKVRSGENEGDDSPVSEFMTTLPQSSSCWRPGLWQIRDKRDGAPGGWTPDTDVMAVPVGDGIDDRQLVSGVIMAYARNEDVTDPVSGKTYSWENQDYLSFLYEGYMLFRTGRYDFISSIDDTAYLAIGGEAVHVCGQLVDGARSSWQCPADGWYKVKMLVGDMTVDGGCITADRAFHYSTDGGQTYNRFLETNGGELLRVQGGSAETRYWFENGRLNIDLALQDPQENSKCYILSGDDDAGDSAQNWDARVELDPSRYTVSGGKISVRQLDVSAPYVRLYVELPTSIAFSELIPTGRDCVRLSPTVEADFSKAVSAVFKGHVVSSVGDAEVSVKIQVSESPDFSGATEYDAGIVAPGGSFERTVDGLSLETTYYWRALASAGDGAHRDETAVAAATTPGAPAFGGISAAGENWNADFSADVSDPGPGGESRLVLLAGESGESLNEIGAVTVSRAGKHDIAFEFDFTNKKIFYAFVLENSTPAGVFSITSEVGTVDLVCSAAYYWKPGVTGGAWEDPANWVDREGNALDPRCAFPNSAKSQVRFDSASDGPVVITVGGAYGVYCLKSGTPKDITIRGTGKNADGEYVSRITAGRAADNGTTLFPDGMKFALDGIEYLTECRYVPPAGSLLELRNGAKMRLGGDGITGIGDGAVIALKGGSVLDVNGEIWHESNAKWKIALDDSEISVTKRVNFSRKGNGGAATVELSGDDPAFSVFNLSVGWESPAAQSARFVFHVPLKGYERAPIRPCGDPDRTLIDWGNSFTSLSVADDSPVFKTPETIDVKLCEWSAKGVYIDSFRATVAENRKSRAGRLTFYFTDAQGGEYFPFIDESGAMCVKDKGGTVWPVRRSPEDPDRGFFSGRQEDGCAVTTFWVRVERSPGFEVAVR